MPKRKSSEVTLQFHDLGDLEKSSVVCFSHAAFANLKMEDLKELL